MIYAYRYLEHHPIEQFHGNIAYFFEQLFAINPPIFDADLLLRPDFIPLINTATVSIINHLTAITRAYHHDLSDDERQEVQRAFVANNDIESICNCGCRPYKYADIPAAIREELRSFFKSLWADYPQTTRIEAVFGTVKAHFDAFVSQGDWQAIVCPFCGIMPLQPANGTYRDAYDHFIPKGYYPFNSVNFQNLVPTCHVCNSNAKHIIDVPFNADGSPRAILYPYNRHSPHLVEAHIVCRVEYERSEHTLLSETKDFWSITLTESGHQTIEMNGWDTVYNIRQRYQDHIIQCERVWWQEVFKKYKRLRHTAFEDFKADVLDDNEDVISKPMGILRKAYYNHLFSIPDVEELFIQTV